MRILNIVVPMAGHGSRFSSRGYKHPKPLIPIHGNPMIKVVIDNLRPTRPHKCIFICQREHVAKYDLLEKLSHWAPGCDVICLDGVTEGAACTVLMARDLINNSSPLMIANSDQYIDFCIEEYLEQMDCRDADGFIMTMYADDPKWSFIEIDRKGNVSRVVEKEVISNEATVGIYNFKRGADFVECADAMVSRDERVNNEFYVAPVFNDICSDGGSVGYLNIGSERNGMFGLGTPSDLEYFLTTSQSRATKLQ